MSAIISPKVQAQAPGASFGREYVATKAGCLLVHEQKGNNAYQIVQYSQGTNEYFRPLVVNLGGLAPMQNQDTNPLKTMYQKIKEEADIDSDKENNANASNLSNPKQNKKKAGLDKDDAMDIDADYKKASDATEIHFTTPNRRHAHFPFTVTTPNRTRMTTRRYLRMDVSEVVTKEGSTSSSKNASADTQGNLENSGNETANKVIDKGIKTAVLFYFSPERNPNRHKDSQTQITRKRSRAASSNLRKINLHIALMET